jgi:ankyrin
MTIHEAAYHGEAGRVGDLISQGTRVNEVDKRGLTALHLASLAGQAIVVQELLDQGAFVDALLDDPFSYYGITDLRPLHLAVSGGKAQIVDMLLQAGADPDSPYRARGDATTALHLAASMGDDESVRLLLEADADPDVLLNGYSPLYIASRSGHARIVERLIASGASTCRESTDIARSAASRAREYNLYSPPRPTARERLLREERNESPAELRVRPILTREFYMGRCAIHQAAAAGHRDTVAVLIDASIVVDVPDRDGGLSALCHAAFGGHVDTMRLLINAGAQTGFRTDSNATPLHFASASGSAEAVELILTASALEMTQALLQQPLGGAASPRHSVEDVSTTDQLRIALKPPSLSGLVPVVPREPKYNTFPSGSTALHVAAIEGHGAIVSLLLAAGYDKTMRDADGMTPLNRAADNGHLDVVQLLQ